MKFSMTGQYKGDCLIEVTLMGRYVSRTDSTHFEFLLFWAKLGVILEINTKEEASCGL
jgi:hypothetical protein